MSEPDDKPVGFFFGPGAEWEPTLTAGSDETASHPAPAAPEPEARSVDAASTESVQPPAQPAPAVGPDQNAGPGATSGTTAEGGAERYSVVNADGSTTTQLADGSFQTVVRLPGGATIVTSTSPPGSSPSATPADSRRERRSRRRGR